MTMKEWNTKTGGKRELGVSVDKQVIALTYFNEVRSFAA